MKKTIVKLSVVAPLFLVGFIGRAIGSNLTVANSKWSISWERLTSAQFKFLGKNVRTGVNLSFVGDASMYAVNIVRLVGSRVIIIGEASGSEVVTIYDLENGKGVDTFFCMDPALSPDGRLIVFKDFQARAAQTQNDVVRLYDLTLSAEANRTEQNRAQPTLWNAGIPIFPKRNTIATTPQQQGYFVWHAFHWSPSGKKLAFAAEKVSMQEMMNGHTTTEFIMVLVDVAGGIAREKAYIRHISVKEILDPKYPNFISPALDSGDISVNDNGIIEFHGNNRRYDGLHNVLKDKATFNLLSQYDDEY